MSNPLRICNLATEATSAPGDDFTTTDSLSYPATKKIKNRNYIGSLALAGATLFVDQINGSDTTGTRGSLTLGYATLTAAKTAAQGGDTIVVYPGIYNEKNLLKNGVNWYFMPGCFVTYSGSIAGGIFDDSTTGASTAITCSIAGSGVFNNQHGGTINDDASVVCIKNASSSVVIECQSINISSLTSSIYRTGVRQTAGYLSVHADSILSGSQNSFGVWWDGGDCHINAARIAAATTGYGVYAQGTSDTQSLWVTADRISGAYGVVIQTANANQRIWIDAKEIRGDQTGLIVNAGKVYIQADKISGTIPWLITGGQNWIDIQKVSFDNGATAAIISDGSAWINIQNVEDLGSSDVLLDLLATSGNSITCNVANLKTGVASVAGVNLKQSVTGRCAFKGLIDTSAATSGNPVLIPDTWTGTLLDGTILISKSGRESVVTDGTATVNVYGVAYVTHAKNASVTLGMGTLTTIAGMT